MSSWRRALALTTLVVVMAGITALLVVQRRGGTRSSSVDRRQGDLLTAAVERRTLTESVTVRGTAGHRSRGVLKAAVAGRLTRLGISPSTDIVTGTAVVHVDGRPVVAVGGTFPFWRDLSRDATGEDVSQLKALLRADGQNPGADDDVFSASTERALKAWQQKRGFPADGTLRVGDTLVGSWPARVGKVSVAVGDFVSVGSEIVSLTDPDLSVTVDLTPSDRLKVKTGQQATVELTATRQTARGSVAELANTPTTSQASSRTQQASGDGKAADGANSNATQTDRYPATISLEGKLEAVDGAQVRVELIIAEARDALVVPVAAIVSDGAGRPTVRVQGTDGRVQSVRVSTGLGEGAYLQVLEGLQESQSVVLRTRR